MHAGGLFETRGKKLINGSPQEFEILAWCPARPVLPHGEKVPLQPWLATLLVMVLR